MQTKEEFEEKVKLRARAGNNKYKKYKDVLGEYGYYRLRKIYTAMKQRCYDKNSANYSKQGAKGITICEEWLNDRNNFYEWACPVLPHRTRLSLTNIGKFKSPFIENKTIKIYVDKKDDSLWYYNPALYNGYGTMIDGTSGYFSLAGWSRITGVRKLLEQGYTPLEIKSALTMYVLEVDRDITQLYEDILLEALQMYSKYLNRYEARNG